METRIIDNNEYDKAKALWAESFGDSSEFIDNYFSTKVDANNIFGLFETGRLVSMLVALSRVLMLRGKTCKSAFLAGCCTAPDSRNKGCMKRLLSYTADILRERGCVLGFLHPFDHGFYRKLGWETVSDMILYECHPRVVSVSGLNVDSYDSQKMLDIYNDFVSDYEIYFIRDLYDINTRINEHMSDGGHVLCDYDSGWYCLFFIEDDYINVIENTCRSDDEYSKMIGELSRYSKPVRYLRPGEYGSGEYTMMRVLDDREALSMFDIAAGSAEDVNKTLCDAARKGSSVFFEQY